MAVRCWHRVAAAALFLCLIVTSAQADKRVALVIGNGGYQHADPLTNPLTDARNIRKALRRLGFDVVYGEDVDQRGLQRLLGRFAENVDDADVAMVYYAGHGATFGDIPYVVPIDADFSSLSTIPYEMVPVETLIGGLRRAKGVRIAILDACRDNQAETNLKRAATRGVASTRGLAPVRDAHGLIVAYGTQFLSTAADGEPDSDSPFTAALLKHVERSGITVQEMFFDVARDVIKTTHGEQRPEISISLFEPYMLGGPASQGVAPLEPRIGVAPPAPPAPPQQPPTSATAPAGAVERVISEDLDYGRYLRRLRQVFPDESRAILDKLSEDNATKKDLDPDVLMSETVSAVRRTHGASASKASEVPLGRIFDSQLKEMRALEMRDPHLCIAFLYGSNGNGFLAFARENRALIADAALASLDAIVSGRTHNVERGAPTDADFQALDKALGNRGLTRTEIEALLDGKTPHPPVAEDRMCNAGKIYLEVLGSMPTDVRDRLYSLAVTLMAKSGGSISTAAADALPSLKSTDQTQPQRRAALLVEDPSEPNKVKTFLGAVLWRRTAAAGTTSFAIEAAIDVPDAKIKATVVFDKNIDVSLSASHTIIVGFQPEADSVAREVKEISVPQARPEGSPGGVTLVGVVLPTTRNRFLVGLSSGDASSDNVKKLKEMPWIDIPMRLGNGRIAKLTFEQSSVGSNALVSLFEQSSSPASTSTQPVQSISSWSSEVRSRIMSKVSQTSSDGHGQVVMKFTVFASGEVGFVRPAQPSGDARTDAAATKAVESSAPFPGPPDHRAHTVQVKISYR